MEIVGLDHVQLAMPPGGEAAARAFYGDLLELEEVAKPADLVARGGCWFERGAVKIHLGTEPDFKPARKAHPGLIVRGLADFVARLQAAGHVVRGDASLAGYDRAHVEDPFGNRIELMEPRPAE